MAKHKLTKTEKLLDGIKDEIDRLRKIKSPKRRAEAANDLVEYLQLHYDLALLRVGPALDNLVARDEARTERDAARAERDAARAELANLKVAVRAAIARDAVLGRIEGLQAALDAPAAGSLHGQAVNVAEAREIAAEAQIGVGAAEPMQRFEGKEDEL